MHIRRYFQTVIGLYRTSEVKVKFNIVISVSLKGSYSVSRRLESLKEKYGV
jgi:hypothetical protein